MGIVDRHERWARSEGEIAARVPQTRELRKVDADVQRDLQEIVQHLAAKVETLQDEVKDSRTKAREAEERANRLAAEISALQADNRSQVGNVREELDGFMTPYVGAATDAHEVEVVSAELAAPAIEERLWNLQQQIWWLSHQASSGAAENTPATPAPKQRPPKRWLAHLTAEADLVRPNQELTVGSATSDEIDAM